MQRGKRSKTKTMPERESSLLFGDDYAVDINNVKPTTTKLVDAAQVLFINMCGLYIDHVSVYFVPNEVAPLDDLEALCNAIRRGKDERIVRQTFIRGASRDIEAPVGLCVRRIHIANF